MKKLMVLAGMLCVCSSIPAHAQISITLGQPQPTIVEQPAPAYAVVPSYPTYYSYGYYDVHHHWIRGRRPAPRHFDRGHRR